MSIIEQIKAEIERLKGQLVRGACASLVQLETTCKEEAYNEVLSFLDTLQEQPVDYEEELNKCKANPLYFWDNYVKVKFKEQPVKTDIVEDLKHYLATTPKEQIEKDWESLKEWGKVGPSVSEFLGWKQPVCEGLDDEITSYIEKHYHIRNDETLERGNDAPTTYDFAEIARHFAQWGAEHRGSSEISNDLQSACDYANFDESHSLNAYIAFEEGFKKGAKWKRDQMMKELRSYCLDEMERFQGTDEVSRAAREVYYDIIGYLDNHGRR